MTNEERERARLDALTPVQQAYERCKVGRAALVRLGRCMEATEDRAGIVWERWVLPNGMSVILFATPHWWDLFRPITTDTRNDATIAALDALAKESRT